MAKNAMNWEVSTTPIPISAPSVIIKAIMSKDTNNIPEQLRYMADLDTIRVQDVRDYTNSQRFKILNEFCAGERRSHCEKWINQADPEFGVTALHLAYASMDYRSIGFLTSLGANEELLDNAGRKPKNLTFEHFIRNSAKKAGSSSCQIPTVDVESIEDLVEIRRLVNEGEPVLIKKALSVLLHGELLSKLTIPQLIERYADSQVTIGEVPYADVFLLPHTVTTLQDFYRKHVLAESSTPLYVFRKNPDITFEALKALSELVEKAFPRDVICPVEYLYK
jgi:hypothetical protein